MYRIGIGCPAASPSQRRGAGAQIRCRRVVDGAPSRIWSSPARRWTRSPTGGCDSDSHFDSGLGQRSILHRPDSLPRIPIPAAEPWHLSRPNQIADAACHQSVQRVRPGGYAIGRRSATDARAPWSVSLGGPRALRSARQWRVPSTSRKAVAGALMGKPIDMVRPYGRSVRSG